MLSEGAVKYLSTLKRYEVIPTKEVEKIIKDSGFPCFDIWLDFHERYAGYVEQIGLDEAILGLFRENLKWISSTKPEIEKEPNEDIWYITCADVHPSHNYRLDNFGEFLGIPAKSFDIHVERCALLWDFTLDKKVKRMNTEELKAYNMSLLTEEKLIKEASDKYYSYYQTKNKLIIKNSELDKITKILELA